VRDKFEVVMSSLVVSLHPRMAGLLQKTPKISAASDASPTSNFLPVFKNYHSSAHSIIIAFTISIHDKKKPSNSNKS
jgi:hypothetical protein